MTLFLLAAAGGVWLWRMTAALGSYDPNFIIPLLQSCYIAFATISYVPPVPYHAPTLRAYAPHLRGGGCPCARSHCAHPLRPSSAVRDSLAGVCVCSGGVFFKEFEPMSIVDPNADNFLDTIFIRWPIFIVGLLTMLLGLYGLFAAGTAGAADDPGSMSTPSNESLRDRAYSSEAGDTLPEMTTTNFTSLAIDPPFSPGGAPSMGETSSTSRVSFAASEVSVESPRHPHMAAMRERASSRSSMMVAMAKPSMQRQMTTGSMAEVLHHNRLSRAILTESLNGADIGQGGGHGSVLLAPVSFVSPSMTPNRKSMSNPASFNFGSPSKRDSWSRRDSTDRTSEASAVSAPGEDSPRAFQLQPMGDTSPKRSSLYRVTTGDKLDIKPATPPAATTPPAEAATPAPAVAATAPPAADAADAAADNRDKEETAEKI